MTGVIKSVTGSHQFHTDDNKSFSRGRTFRRKSKRQTRHVSLALQKRCRTFEKREQICRNKSLPFCGIPPLLFSPRPPFVGQEVDPGAIGLLQPALPVHGPRRGLVAQRSPSSTFLEDSVKMAPMDASRSGLPIAFRQFKKLRPGEMVARGLVSNKV